jgi:hypothetical protein
MNVLEGRGVPMSEMRRLYLRTETVEERRKREDEELLRQARVRASRQDFEFEEGGGTPGDVDGDD